MIAKDKADNVRRARIYALLGFAAFVILSEIAFYFVGMPMIQFVKEPALFRAFVDSKGIGGQVVFVGMVALQVLVAIIPGEPLEIAAGYTFGSFTGTFLCLIGQAIGSILVFLFVKYVGIHAVEVFFSKEKIQSLRFLRNEKKLAFTTFILFFIPGTPKDILTYFVGLTPMKLWQFLLISSVARIPSVITSTIGGDSLGIKNYNFAILVFSLTAVISGIGILVYGKITKAHESDTINKQKNDEDRG